MRTLIPLCLIATVACHKDEASETADLVFINGVIHVDVDTTATALAANKGVIVALDGKAEELNGKGTEVVDLDGAHAFAGFQDAHTHLLPGSFVLDRLLIRGANSMDHIIGEVEKYAAETPDEPWIVAYGWLANDMLADDPRGIDLDPVTGDRPALLVDASGHNALVNSKALQMAGINAQTPDPPGGTIARDPISGEPTGLLQENALSLVSETAMADYDDALLGAAVPGTLDDFSAAGLTGIADVMASPGFNVARPQIYADLEAAGELPVRIHYYTPIFTVDDVAVAETYRGLYDGELVRFAGGKLWVDGSASSGEAWITDPAADDPDNYGSHYFEIAQLAEIIGEAEAREIPLKLHCQGDAAVKAAIDAFEQVAGTGVLTQQHTLEHLSLVDPVDLSRMEALGLMASVQPILAVLAGAGSLPEVWGDERFEASNDFRGLVDAGVPIAMSTDWPVWPTGDPIVNIWGGPMAAHPITAAEGVWGYSEGTARSVGRDDLGRLDVGYQVDLGVFDADLIAIDPADITNYRPTAMWVAGRQVW